jgi:hypothetical protein
MADKKITKGIDMSYEDFIYKLKMAIDFDEDGNVIIKNKKCNCKKCDK